MIKICKFKTITIVGKKWLKIDLFTSFSFYFLPLFLLVRKVLLINGENLGILWVLPFVGILLSIAIFPLVAEHFWHHNFGKISYFGLYYSLFLSQYPKVCRLLFMSYYMLVSRIHPFLDIIVITIYHIWRSPVKRILGWNSNLNTLIIFIGTAMASWMGTTGAAMLLIRPLIRANQYREKKVHIIVFFIFLVANIGGSLTPLGDPPLFLGFLKGVDFFWTTTAMFMPMLFMVICLLIIFFAIDTFFYKKETNTPENKDDEEKLGLEGSFNLILLAGVVGGVLLSGFWKPHIHINIYHVHVELQNIVRDILLLCLTYTS